MLRPETTIEVEKVNLDFAMSVARGLSRMPRRLECRFLYDAQGSALFERICEQPEYYLTRTEAGILRRAAHDIARRTGALTLVELGSGSSVKTQILLKAYINRYGEVSYTPVDVSASILEHARQELTGRLPGVRVYPLNGTYDEAFPLVASLSPCLLLFLGSTVGNLNHEESDAFWENVRLNLPAGDRCLLGIDINEDEEALHAAYNDSAGVSAAFTRNLFERMNRELGTAIDTGSIEHDAAYSAGRRRVEIFARFTQPQRIEIGMLGRSFHVDGGERIRTEISRKFRLAEIVPYLAGFSLMTEQIYQDDNNRVAVLLLRRV